MLSLELELRAVTGGSEGGPLSKPGSSFISYWVVSNGTQAEIRLRSRPTTLGSTPLQFLPPLD